MAKGTVSIQHVRWDQVEVGDTIIDYSWAYPRWVTIYHIQEVNGTIHALFSGQAADEVPLHKWYRTNPAKIVEVQVILP